MFDRQRGNDGVQALREWLIRDKYLQAQVDYDVEDHADRRRVVFRIQPGPRYDKIVLAFEGASGISPDRLDKIKAFVFDWDGVFNNGAKDSEGASPFNEVDAMGTNLLRFNHHLRRLAVQRLD